MRRVAILLLVAAFACGLEPIPPLGCRHDPHCVCDASGNCVWIFACDD